MAGLWSTFIRTDGTKLHTCTIITTEANELMQKIHDRMPVILDGKSEKEWLNPRNTNIYTLTQLLKPYDFKKMKSYKVSPLVNNASNDLPECIKPV